MGTGPLAGADVVTDEVTDDAMGKDGAEAGFCADGLTVPAHAAADTTTANSTKALRNGKIL